MAKLNFQQPLLQSSVSHDPAEIILINLFGAQEKIIYILSMLKAVCAVFFLLWELWYIYLRVFIGE